MPRYAVTATGVKQPVEKPWNADAWEMLTGYLKTLKVGLFDACIIKNTISAASGACVTSQDVSVYINSPTRAIEAQKHREAVEYQKSLWESLPIVPANE